MPFETTHSSAGNGDRALFSVDCEQRLVIAKFGECLTATDIQKYVQRLLANPGFDSSFSEIADISEVRELPLDVSDLLELADRIDPFSLDSKRAFVVQTPSQERAALMHKLLRNQRNFEVFHSLAEAKNWIRN